MLMSSNHLGIIPSWLRWRKSWRYEKSSRKWDLLMFPSLLMRLKFSIENMKTNVAKKKFAKQKLIRNLSQGNIKIHAKLMIMIKFHVVSWCKREQKQSKILELSGLRKHGRLKKYRNERKNTNYHHIHKHNHESSLRTGYFS